MVAHLAAARVPLPRLQASGEEPPTLDELLKALGNLPLDDEEEDMAAGAHARKPKAATN
jgi:heterodisulfide reductase subunit B